LIPKPSSKCCLNVPARRRASTDDRPATLPRTDISDPDGVLPLSDAALDALAMLVVRIAIEIEAGKDTEASR